MKLAKTKTVTGLALMGLLGALACAGGGAPEESASGLTGPSLLADGAKVSGVEVAAAEAMPAGGNRGQFDKYDAAKRLHDRLMGLLESGGQFAEDGELRVRVTASDFRLRSGALAFWVGAMAGADDYNVDVEVVKGEEVLKTFKTDTSTILGGIAYASPTQRSERMIHTLAQRIYAGL